MPSLRPVDLAAAGAVAPALGGLQFPSEQAPSEGVADRSAVYLDKGDETTGVGSSMTAPPPPPVDPDDTDREVGESALGVAAALTPTPPGAPRLDVTGMRNGLITT